MKIEFDSEEEKQKQIDFHTKMIQYHQSQVSKCINAVVLNTPDMPVKAHYESFVILWDKMPKKTDRIDAEKRWAALSKTNKKRLYEYVDRMCRGEWAGKEKNYVKALSVIINKKTYLDEPEIEAPKTMSPPIKCPPHQRDSVTEPINKVGDREGKSNAARIIKLLQLKSL